METKAKVILIKLASFRTAKATMNGHMERKGIFVNYTVHGGGAKNV